ARLAFDFFYFSKGLSVLGLGSVLAGNLLGGFSGQVFATQGIARESDHEASAVQRQVEVMVVLGPIGRGEGAVGIADALAEVWRIIDELRPIQLGEFLPEFAAGNLR